MLRHLAGACHRLIAASRATVAVLPDRLRARTTIVANATPEPQIAPGTIELDERTGPLHFVIASRWTTRKGHGTLLEAWDRLDGRGQLTILGGPSLSGDSIDVGAIVAALRHPATVTLVGEVADVASYLDAADVALVPSDEPESFGLVAIEAFAHGRAVIASALGGLLDIIDPGENGWVFRAGDVDALAGLLAGLSRADVASAGASARRSYEKHFTAAAYGRRWRAAVGEFG